VSSPDLQGARVWVTGAAGFVGANLCRALLASGAAVHAVVRPGGARDRLAGLAGELRILELDLCDRLRLAAALRGRPPDVVCNAAAQNVRRQIAPLHEVVANNYLATACLLEALDGLDGVRLVHLASFLEYGPGDRPHRETDPLRPTSPRGATKAGAALLVAQQARAGAVDAVVLRIFSVYGPWEPDRRLVPRAIRAALDGTELPLTRPGLRRDYVFVGDVAEACVRAAQVDGLGGEVVNIGSGVQTTNEALVDEVGRVSGRVVQTAVGAHPAHGTDTACCVADISRAREQLGWSPRHALVDGLARTVDWMRGRP